MDTGAIVSTLDSSEGLLFTAFHVASASAVTIHALLTKREVRAAIGWIGVAWLSPVFGALLYLGFGINRVHRKARKLRGRVRGLRRSRPVASRSPAERLQIAIGNITGLEVEPGTVDAILNCGDEAYPEMLAAIDAAQKSVMLATFIFRTDEPGMKFIDALARAHRRGVAVRVLIDGMGGGFILSRAYRRLRREGVPVARFLHSIWPWTMALLDLRLHKKALIVDGQFAFVGGLNIGAENVIAKPTSSPVRDTHFRVLGPIVRQIGDSFQDDWSFTTGESLPDLPPVPLPPEKEASRARAISSGPDQAFDQLVMALMSAITSARRSIKIATPYFLPEEQILTALRLAALRGVEVKLVTPRANNHKMIAWASQGDVRPLLEAGCQLWRSPPPFDHSKLMTVDDEWSLIGSANWDARSLRLNFELTVEFYDGDLAKRISALIDRKCVEPMSLADLDRRSFVIKLRDASVRLLAPYL